jgi:hypothetical protein
MASQIIKIRRNVCVDFSADEEKDEQHNTRNKNYHYTTAIKHILPFLKIQDL